MITVLHMMSYQITSAVIQQAFDTAKAHSNPDGIFIFDCWYGPSDLTERPETRVKHLEADHIQLKHIAPPELYSK